MKHDGRISRGIPTGSANVCGPAVDGAGFNAGMSRRVV
jgi:hypothetical protein